MVFWWPLGIHRALHGTNFDLPVSQADFFATFADILKYPLPKGDSCVYSYNSDNAAVHNQTASRIGRPGLQPTTPNPVKWLAAMKNWDWSDTSKTIFDASVVYRGANGKAVYLKEVSGIGFDRIEQWLTKEDQTGFILGWDGCMAEDSQSFSTAFNAHKVSTQHRDGKEYHQFDNDLTTVPTKLMTGKLGDMAIRLGRYKLIRYNAPKDYRTGPNRQHLVDHEGKEWHNAAPADRCNYDNDGKLLNPGCTVEPLCRRHTTFGQTFCMRDHYYQLFDLETNFGEKMFCDASSNAKIDPYLELSNALGVDARGNFEGIKKGEKPTDPFGYSLGTETSPAAAWLNDCCVLNLDEKPDDLIISQPSDSKRRRRSTNDPCEQIQIDRNGQVSNAGRCIYKAAIANKYG